MINLYFTPSISLKQVRTEFFNIRHRLNINFVKVDFLPMAGLDGFEADCLEYLDTSFITRMLFHAEYFLHQQPPLSNNNIQPI